MITTQQADKLRDEKFGQGIVTLFEKPADIGNGGLAPQITILPELEFGLLLWSKGEGL